MMTVKELMEKLAQYNENALVVVSGGETAEGDYAELVVVSSMNEYWNCDGTVIMENFNDNF